VVHGPSSRGDTVKRKLILGAVLALLLSVTSVSLAFASGDPKGDKNRDKVRVLQVTLTNSQETDLDLGDSGPSGGDRFSVFGDLVRNDKQVGVAGYECVTLLFRPGPDPAGQPEALTDQCVGTLSLPKGQITMQGLVDRGATGSLPITIAITGGTGAYRTAHGELQTSGPNEQGDEPLTLKLIL
jgi:allene oxide cyclase-like protein